ncbi:MAG: hypothetical protein JXA67_19215 [Micromonosporaceae bacterium]|nr:hypothetical protein [Micromonosporaceae bacterium]
MYAIERFDAGRLTDSATARTPVSARRILTAEVLRFEENHYGPPRDNWSRHLAFREAIQDCAPVSVIRGLAPGEALRVGLTDRTSFVVRAWHPDDEPAQRSEREANGQPDNFGTTVDAYYTTHLPLFQRCPRSDDLVAESNYESARDQAMRVADDALAEVDGEPDVIDAHVRHWGWGLVDELFVRTRDANGAYTAAWRTATGLRDALQDYPLLDEDDYRRREQDAAQASLEVAINDAAAEYRDDSPLDEAVITAHLRQCAGTARCPWDLADAIEGTRVDHHLVAEMYRQARDAYYLHRAVGYHRGMLDADRCPGQLELFPSDVRHPTFLDPGDVFMPDPAA